jgi:copper chaperone CopZ
LPQKTGESPKKAIAILNVHIDYPNGTNYRKIEESMKNLPGVTKTRMNYVAGAIELNYDPAKVTLERIKEKLRNVESDDARRNRKRGF